MHCDIFRDYVNAVTANKLDLPLAQVEAVNSCLLHADPGAPLSITKVGTGTVLCVEYECEDIFRAVYVEATGYLDWTCGGAFPEIAHWNKPRGGA